MFATTRQFLDYFNLKSLQELPPLSEIRDLDKLNPELALDDDDMAGMRVLDLPPEPSEDDEDERDGEDSGVLDPNDDDYLDEEEAIALAKRPLDEILGVGQFSRKDDESLDMVDEQPDTEKTED
ncbi:MAG: hypothetical protein A3H44_06570 [Gammaproteobacteria bacterium RIFCSPLOWO2_02_FULL_57_10]|nr:MAG: hypothetical protein A3H44_06570 [Gammaproteobacteria bacterium RIFCSPLOWO2_02_FULL_57_10]